MAVKRVLVFVFLCLAAPAAAGQTGGAFAVRALGVKVGDFSLTGSVSAGKYTASAQFVTTGLIGAVASVHFLLSATGTRSGSRFAPQHYAEQMDTGERRSRARLTYSGGVARSTGAQTGDRSTGAQTGGGPHAVSDAQQQGAVDPLTAMFVVLRDQPREGLCRTRQTIFDGERLSRIVLTTRSEAGGEVTCTGLFRPVPAPGGLCPGRHAQTPTVRAARHLCAGRQRDAGDADAGRNHLWSRHPCPPLDATRRLADKAA